MAYELFNEQAPYPSLSLGINLNFLVREHARVCIKQSKIILMNWFTGSKQGEAKRLIAQLADATKRDRAAQDLIGLGADAVPALIEALQTRDLNLFPIYEQILARIPSASPTLIKVLATAHPIIRARIVDVFALSRD